MSQITIMRTERAMPMVESILDGIRAFLFGFVDGFTRDDKRAWRRIWKRIRGMQPGELMVIDVVQPRSTPYHRRHMKIEQSVFDAQERFDDFEIFRDWLKVGAGFVVWCAGPSGGVVPIPKSISYAKADQDEFEKYHESVVAFLRGKHAAKFLWRHLGESGSAEMMDAVLQEFDE